MISLNASVIDTDDTYLDTNIACASLESAESLKLQKYHK